MSALAVQFLCEGNSSFALDPEQAQQVVPYLRWVSYAAGTLLYREADSARTGYMLLLLEGNVSVELGAAGQANRVALSVVGPGSLIGEMAFLDGAPRSANCSAISIVQAAGMSQTGLDLLAKDKPHLAFKLMAILARCTISRLRALGEQLYMMDSIVESMHQELTQLRHNQGTPG